MTGKSRVSYFYHPQCPLFYYGPGHPMKPHRIKLTHHLVLSYGLYKEMECYRPHPAAAVEMAAFHSEDYIHFLQKASPDNLRSPYGHAATMKFNVGEDSDCPAFDGLFEFTQLYTGGSLDAAVQLCQGTTDVAINWSGGLHHAKKSEASGFCYINDIVLAILELLKVHARVLYIDIDIHHGDGVEEAFYTTDRVMTFSLHKYGDYFPGTGAICDIGAQDGVGYALNAPLHSGITDETYFTDLYQPVLQKIMQVYQPGAIVIDCGADSIVGDRLGCFNLTLKGHAACVEYAQSFGVPLLVLGGGGYTMRNVARCWAYETATLLGKHHDIGNDIPYNDYYEYFGPDFELHLKPEPMENLNTPEFLEKIRVELLQQLQDLHGAPSCAMQQVPPTFARAVAEQAEESADRERGWAPTATGGDGSTSKRKTEGHGKQGEYGLDKRDPRSKTKHGDGVRKQHPSEFYDKLD